MSKIVAVSLAELKSYLAAKKVPRGINEIVLHHTWSPTAKQYKGTATWTAIRDYHVNVRGWSDIGYHFGIGPDSTVWRLRPVERSGAHVLNRNAHTVGVALVGNFDVEDPMANGLPMAALVFRILLDRFGLGIGAVRFHREFQNKTCPGTRIDLAAFRQLVAEAMVPGAVPFRGIVHGDAFVQCCAAIESGILRADVRPLLEALGHKVDATHLEDQGKVYVE